MWGFDRSTFVELRQSDCDQFTCGICLSVVNNPVETQCYRKTHCKKCITTWINTNQMCPNDRRVLRTVDLLNPSIYYELLLQIIVN